MKPYAEERQTSGANVFHQAIAEKDTVEEDTFIPMIDEEEEEVIDPKDVEVFVSDEPEEEVEKKEDPFEKLANLLVAKQTPIEPVVVVPERAKPEAVDMEALKKDFNKELHETDDPFALIQKTTQAVIGGTLAGQNLQIQKLKKNALKADPDKKFIMDNYENEVETVISSLPADQQSHPDAYDYAINQVTLRNMDALKKHWVEEETKKIPTSVKPGKNKMVGQGASPNNTKGKKRVRATKVDEANARRYGMTVKNWLIKEGRL